MLNRKQLRMGATEAIKILKKTGGDYHRERKNNTTPFTVTNDDIRDKVGDVLSFAYALKVAPPDEYSDTLLDKEVLDLTTETLKNTIRIIGHHTNSEVS